MHLVPKDGRGRVQSIDSAFGGELGFMYVQARTFGFYVFNFMADDGSFLTWYSVTYTKLESGHIAL